MVREALKALIERESARRLARLGGSEPEVKTAPRRRPARALCSSTPPVWIGRPRAHDDVLARLLDTAAVCMHPYIVGEVGLGSLRQRGIVLRSLSALPHVTVAIDREVLPFVERHALFGRGIGYVDVCLLAATSLTPNARIWTHDMRLHAVATELGLACSPPFRPEILV